MHLTIADALCNGTEKWTFCLLPIVWKRNEKRKMLTFEFFSRWSLHFQKSLINGQITLTQLECCNGWIQALWEG